MTNLIRVQDESIHGIAYWDLKRRANRHELYRVHRGRYLPTTGASDDEHWRHRLAAHLDRGGPKSVISHRAAARLHALEGFPARAEDISVPPTCGWKQSPAIRSNSLPDQEAVTVDGLRVTSVGRTLIDVGRFVVPDVLELAVEHALRGRNRRRPEEWNRALLTMLFATMELRRVPRSLRIVLDRRGMQNPTGSYAETLLAQGFRRTHVDGLFRQARIDVSGVAKKWRFYPDFADLRRGLLIEVDGRAGHEGDDNVDRDDRRQNLLGEGFRILRFHARTVIANPDAVAMTVASVRASLPVRPAVFHSPGAVVETTPNGARLSIRHAGGR